MLYLCFLMTHPRVTLSLFIQVFSYASPKWLPFFIAANVTKLEPPTKRPVTASPAVFRHQLSLFSTQSRFSFPDKAPYSFRSVISPAGCLSNNILHGLARLRVKPKLPRSSRSVIESTNCSSFLLFPQVSSLGLPFLSRNSLHLV